MASYNYSTKGVCARRIHFDLEDDIVKNVRFEGGCEGNAKGLSALLEGQKKQDVITRLQGIRCGGRSTSCPDQLANALKDL